jgi:hypothetical protein
MEFVKKSIKRKLLFVLLVTALFNAVIIFGLEYFEVKKYFADNMWLYWLGLSLMVALITWVVIYRELFKPLKTVMYEMQALIAGKNYKRILTDRIDEIGVLAHFFNQVTRGLGKVSSDIKDRDRMLSELTIASQLQRDILPTEKPKIPGLDIIAKSKPASELGGDSFNYFTKQDKTYVYIGDVTGHGVAAGLIMTMANSLISVFADIYSDPYHILVHVNKYIKKHVKKAMFMTLVMICWDHKTQKMTYVGAGHEHVLIYRAKTGECEAKMSGGVALGMVPDNSKVIQEQEIQLNDGDFIVLYSDGITEAKNSKGEMFGLKKLKNLVKEYAVQYSAEGVNYHIAKDVSEFMAGHGQDDDITLIVVKRDSKITA